MFLSFKFLAFISILHLKNVCFWTMDILAVSEVSFLALPCFCSGNIHAKMFCRNHRQKLQIYCRSSFLYLLLPVSVGFDIHLACVRPRVVLISMCPLPWHRKMPIGLFTALTSKASSSNTFLLKKALFEEVEGNRPWGFTPLGGILMLIMTTMITVNSNTSNNVSSFYQAHVWFENSQNPILQLRPTLSSLHFSSARNTYSTSHWKVMRLRKLTSA